MFIGYDIGEVVREIEKISHKYTKYILKLEYKTK